MADPITTVIDMTSLGPPGAIIAMLAGFIYFLVREHRAERSEWIEAYKENSEMWNTAQKESNRIWEESQKRQNELMTKIFLEHENVMKYLQSKGIKING